MSLPVVTICGNLKRIETKFLPSGKEMTSFQVECSEKNSKGEWQNLYIKGEVWEKSSQFVKQYFQEGSVAIVTGKLITNVYEKQDGTKVYEIKFLFPNVSFAPKDKSENQSQNTAPQQYNQGQPTGQSYQQQPQNMQNPPQGGGEYIDPKGLRQTTQPTLDMNDEIPF